MTTLPQVPADAKSCGHFLHHGDRYGCLDGRDGGQCTPAMQDIRSLHKCGGFTPTDRKGDKPKTKPAPKVDCLHFKEATGRHVECSKPGCNAKLDTFRCAIHGECTPKTPGKDVAGCCAHCKQKLTEDDKANLPTDLETVADRPPGWNQDGKVIEAMRLAFSTAAHRASFAKPYQSFQGRGIVTSGGGRIYFPCVWIMLNVLRRHGCTLPVEVWHLGAKEMSPEMVQLLETIPGVRCVDGTAIPGMRIPGGWQLKFHAIRESAFREALWLDADQVPARDPSYLFDTPEYQATGLAVWPDSLPMGWQITRTAFYVAGLPDPGNPAQWRIGTSGYVPLETGQMMWDKMKAWKTLDLAHWANSMSDFFYPPGGRPFHCYGDTGPPYLAIHRLGTPYAMPTQKVRVTDAGYKHPKSTGHSAAQCFLQHDFAGEVVFQHRVQPHPHKWFIDMPELNFPCPGMLWHEWCVEFLADLRTKWSGRVQPV